MSTTFVISIRERLDAAAREYAVARQRKEVAAAALEEKAAALREVRRTFYGDGTGDEVVVRQAREARR